MSDKSRSPKKNEDEIDKELEDSFPASDPPSFNPGHAGEPLPPKSDGDRPKKK